MPNPVPTETELKFLLDPDAEAGVVERAGLSAPEKVRTLCSTYFDTPDRRLRSHGLALRLRDDGHGTIQTLKQAGAVTRGEWEKKVSAADIDIAALGATPAGAVLNGEAKDLAPVFQTRIERRTRLCRDGGGQIEIAFDVGEIIAGERREPIREMELELKRGEPDALFRLAHKLSEGGDIRLSLESKSERGFRLADDTLLEPRRSAAAGVRADMTAGQAFAALGLGCLTQAAANSEILRAQNRPEALHQLRVAIRRLRALIKAYEPMLGQGEGLLVEAELKWLAGQLDAARDLDVFITAGFGPAVEALAEQDFAALGHQLLKAQTGAYAKAQAAVRSPRCAALWLEAASWIEAGGWTRAADPVVVHLRDQPVEDFAAEALDHLRKVVRKRGRRFATLDAKGRHKLRIRAKRMRYVVEFFSPLFGDAKGRRGFLKRLKAMQTALGELNDIAVARGRLAGAAGLKAPAVTFAAGRVVGWREQGERRQLKAAARRVEAFCAAAAFWR